MDFALDCAMPSVMTTQRKLKWTRKSSCKCVKTDLPQTGPVIIRCAEHRGIPSKSGRLLCYWDDDGIVRREGHVEA